MTDDIEQLKQNYRRIEAPPELRARVRAGLAKQPARTHRWVPITATALAAVAVLFVAQLGMQQSPAPDKLPDKPSLTALARLMQDKPALRSPSMSQLKSVKAPKMPRKPSLRSIEPPQSRIEGIIGLEEENPHV
ncbi:MAG: hypothetical protein QNJ73_05240 [Gammaproteobacteria bacterium]|nr:hypothetical protein [Gammaproteobacteria bacterium]